MKAIVGCKHCLVTEPLLIHLRSSGTPYVHLNEPHAHFIPASICECRSKTPSAAQPYCRKCISHPNASMHMYPPSQITLPCKTPKPNGYPKPRSERSEMPNATSKISMYLPLPTTTQQSRLHPRREAGPRARSFTRTVLRPPRLLLHHSLLR